MFHRQIPSPAASSLHMSDAIRCPECHAEFQLSTAIQADIEARLRTSLQAQFDRELLRRERALEETRQTLALESEQTLDAERVAIREREAKAAEERFSRLADERIREKDAALSEALAKVAASSTKEAALLRKEREVAAREQAAELAVEERVQAMTAHIREVEAKAARERLERESSDRLRAKDELLAETRRKLDESVAAQALLVAKERDLTDRERNLALEHQRAISEEVARVREQEAARAAERIELEREQWRLSQQDARLEKESLQRNLDELRRKLEQRPAQAHGEAQEVRLRDLLAETFVTDAVEDVPSGCSGADVLHHVTTREGRAAGTLIWESKRTKTWQAEWLVKLRDDQRAVGATCAVIVTQTLPAGVRHFALIEGVWVCGWPYATALAVALRQGLLEVSMAKRVAEGRGEKTQMLYEYATSPEFRNRVSGVVEATTEMLEDLEREQRAMRTMWQRRSRQIIRARDNVATMVGDVQGILGRPMDDMLAFDLVVTRSLPPPPGENDEAIGELLFSLVPEDGTSVGNGALFERLQDRAMAALALDVTQADYERCRDALIAAGRLRRGKGKGGSVARIVEAHDDVERPCPAILSAEA